MEPTDLSVSPACRILLVSGDLAHGKELVSRIQPLISTPLTPHSDDESYVDWTITNKYYSAPVHLYLHQASKPPAKPLWPPETDGERVPALVFIFKKGEPYRDTFLSMREAYLAHDPEVALAVALPPSSNSTATLGSVDSVEEFFSNHNFEYIDAEDQSHTEEEQPQYDVSGLPRILEALNTIMWPSMVRTPHGGLRRHIMVPDLDEPDAFDYSFATVSDTAPPHHPSLFDAGAGPSEQSLAELNAWLDNDDSWAPSTNTSNPPSTSTSPKTDTHTKAGFEDDFSDFLSAPPILGQENDLPPSAEVQAAAERIFGQSLDHDAPEGFDLTSVLGSLEAMRAEISEITNMEERRKAAARVALGLAMGLGLDGSDSDEPDEDLLRELHQM
ncbi:hypothetical protein FS749_005456 [Ceratobasidium sp. UAMH 11750]|nr:hypothetical protein FS749_005456 [Ceratobasidium sp. UAMH 11750]